MSIRGSESYASGKDLECRSDEYELWGEFCMSPQITEQDCEADGRKQIAGTAAMQPVLR
jgi:hypothetical protein